ncbi:hypothetical protein JRO89_XS05G0260900 [Xanthoceras sorbifolium]|uniref:Uncharacterized protein n=1 Tax=Xanthoceras sorbifolium TaxID=99658 RepID=A0ABQ8I3Y7_9ROSI|nr:hypothetical protein JRO89_XS05G0260900 [Xanthoceras sorbifolium]
MAFDERRGADVACINGATYPGVSLQSYTEGGVHVPEQRKTAIGSSLGEPAEWGRATIIDAERRLLANALLDFSNERFVLLSETCIPLFNFTTIYNYLINSNHSFQGSIDDPRPMGRGRYNKRMWPTVSLSDWRKGSQWFEVHRRIAVEIVEHTIQSSKTIAGLHVT